MEARTYIETRQIGRQLTDATARFDIGPSGEFSRTPHSAIVEIFKKTPTIPGLKPRGPDVAQDLREFDVIALLTMTSIERETRAEVLNAKLTDKETQSHKSKRMRRATNHTSGAMWIDASQVRSAPSRAATRAGQVHEKYSDADI